MTATLLQDRFLTLGEVATHFGVLDWKVRRLFQRGLLPQAQRFGRYRVFEKKELPTIAKALREAGYLK